MEKTHSRQSDHLALLEQAGRYAQEYICGVDDMPPYPGAESLAKLELFEEPIPQHPSDPAQVIEQLHTLGAAATTANTGGRYFGFVNGGLLPVAHAAQWMTDTWNQNSALYVMSPIAAKLEEVCEGWLAELLGLQAGTAAGFVSGSSNATICALAAARNHLLQRQGYDVVENGLRGAPPIRVVAGAESHSSVLKALALLGLGRRDLVLAPTDEMGRVRPETLPALDANTILIIQAGNVSGGGYDPIGPLCDLAQRAGAWVHLDGAFGLWAAASKRHRHLVAGLEKADSHSVDAHKTLNAGYDCGIVLCRHREALVSAMQATGAYLNYGSNRDGMLYTTEMSRRSRAIVLWAVLKQLGRAGVEELVDTLCARAEYFAAALAREGLASVSPVSFNQFMLQCQTPAQTKELLERVQGSGVCWCSGSVWRGEPAIRISVCSHKTAEADIDKSVAAFVEARNSLSI